VLARRLRGPTSRPSARGRLVRRPDGCSRPREALSASVLAQSPSRPDQRGRTRSGFRRCSPWLRPRRCSAWGRETRQAPRCSQRAPRRELGKSVGVGAPARPSPGACVSPARPLARFGGSPRSVERRARGPPTRRRALTLRGRAAYRALGLGPSARRGGRSPWASSSRRPEPVPSLEARARGGLLARCLEAEPRRPGKSRHTRRSFTMEVTDRGALSREGSWTPCAPDFPPKSSMQPRTMCAAARSGLRGRPEPKTFSPARSAPAHLARPSLNNGHRPERWPLRPCAPTPENTRWQASPGRARRRLRSSNRAGPLGARIWPTTPRSKFGLSLLHGTSAVPPGTPPHPLQARAVDREPELHS